MTVAVAVVCILVSGLPTAIGQQQTATSRLNLPLQQRLDAPQTVAAASVTLRDFVGFIANSFKVPMLVESTSPVPDLKIPAGTYSARQLLDKAVRQLRGYKWKDELGVAHLYQPELVASPGNLLNVKIETFLFPQNVADFSLYFRACIHSAIHFHVCSGGLITGIRPTDLANEPLPSREAFKDVEARAILLKALQTNGRFYVLIAYEGTRPKLTSDFPFINWFTQSLVPAEPSPMWIQRPPKSHRSR